MTNWKGKHFSILLKSAFLKTIYFTYSSWNNILVLPPTSIYDRALKVKSTWSKYIYFHNRKSYLIIRLINRILYKELSCRQKVYKAGILSLKTHFFVRFSIFPIVLPNIFTQILPILPCISTSKGGSKN